MHNLYNPAFYKGCRVTNVDPNILVIHGVGGSKLRLTFERSLTGWSPRMRVTANLDDQPTPNHVNLASEVEVTQSIKDFWQAMVAVHRNTRDDHYGERLNSVRKIMQDDRDPEADFSSKNQKQLASSGE
jgi:hypothetical protein